MRRSLLSILPHKDGTSAVEFAIIAPIFVVMVFGIICFGIIISTYNGVQQLAAEAARASVAGINQTERCNLVKDYINQKAPSYMLDVSKLNFTTVAGTTTTTCTKTTVDTTSTASTTYQVSVTYDMSTSPVFTLSRLIPMPSSVIRRSATAVNGGA